MATPNIQSESALLSSNNLDIDKLRRKYVKRDSDIGVYFVSPYLLAYEKYRQYLLKNSNLRQLISKYYYRPDYLSYDVYGTTMFWTILLFINNVPSIEDFTIDEVYIPSYSSINTLSDLRVDESAVFDLDQANSYRVKWPKLYVPMNQPVINSNPVETSVSLAPYVRDKFNIGLSDITNQYVILSSEPLIESIVVRLQNQIIVPLYGVHYIVTLDESLGKYIVDWSEADTPDGSGLKDVILLNSIIEVQYQTTSATQ